MRYAMRPEQTFWQRLAERAWVLIVRRDVDLLEITFGVLMSGWGIQLLMPWDTFRTGVGYRVLAAVAPEWAWGGLLLALGLAKIGSYLLDHRRVRMGATLAAVMVWTFLGVAFGTGNPYGTGIVIYPTLAFVSAVIFWRLLTSKIDQQ